MWCEIGTYADGNCGAEEEKTKRFMKKLRRRKSCCHSFHLWCPIYKTATPYAGYNIENSIEDSGRSILNASFGPTIQHKELKIAVFLDSDYNLP